MMVETGRAGPAVIVFLTPSGQRNQQHIAMIALARIRRETS